MNLPPTPILMMILLLVGVIAFAFGSYLWDHRKQIIEIHRVRKHYRKKDRLCIDYWRIDDIFIRDTAHHNKAEPRFTWVPKETTDESLYRAGYLKAIKWMDDLRYVGIPVFVQLHNFKLIDLERDWKEIGLDRPIKMTSSTMYNVYKNESMKRNISGLTKINFAAIDVKSLIVLLPIIIGVVFGCMYLMKVI